MLPRSLGRKKTQAEPSQQQGLPSFQQDIRGVVAGGAVDAQADLHAGREILLDGRDAGGQAHVRARTMRRTDPATGELADLVVIDVDGVGKPDVVAQPVERLHPGDRTQAVLLERVAFLVPGLAEMRVQQHLVGAGELGRLFEQVGADRERRAWPQDNAGHGAGAGIVIGSRSTRTQSFKIACFVLDAVVGRQSAPRFAQRHRAAAGVKADADFFGGGDLIVDAAAVWKDIRVIKDGRAAGRRQLGEPDERRPTRRLRRTAGPDPVVRAQPGKEVIVLRGRQVSRQRLVEVVVDIHKSGQDDLPGQIEHLVGARGKLVRGADLLDDSIPGEEAGVLQFASRFVHRHQHGGVLGEERGHGCVTPSDLWFPKRTFHRFSGSKRPGLAIEGFCFRSTASTVTIESDLRTWSESTLPN